MIYEQPGHVNAVVQFKKRYDNYINGKWTPPVKGNYFDNPTPVTGESFVKLQDRQKKILNLR